MKPANRFLLIFGAVIGFVAVIATALVLILGGSDETLLSEGTPEGTVQRFFLAIENADYEQAYEYYTTTFKNKTSYSKWVGTRDWSEQLPGWKVTLGKTTVTGTNAVVSVAVDIFKSEGITVNPVRSNPITFSLKIEENRWVITEPTSLWRIFPYY